MVFAVFVASEVVHIAFERCRNHAAGVCEALAHVEKVPVGISLVEQAYLHIGLQAAVYHRLAAYEVDHPEAIHAVRESVGFQLYEALAQVGRQYLVGVYRQHIAVVRQPGGILPLRAVACERARGDAAPVAAAYVDGGVGRAGVYHHYLVGHAYQRVEAALDVSRLVVGYYRSS